MNDSTSTDSTADVDTYYERRGQGTPLVFVHGGWLDRRMWEPQIEALAGDYDVVVYDLRGHGRTGPTDRRRYSIDLLAADLRALVERLNLDRPFVCGLSLGGMVAQAYAASYPGRIRGLVLADTAVSTRLTYRDRMTRLFAPAWSISAAVDLFGTRHYADLAFLAADWLKGREWLGQDPAVRRYVHGTMADFDRDEFGKVLRAIYEYDGVDLSKIGMPTLVLRGEHEDHAVVEHAEHLRRELPNARRAVIPDAGHTPNMENPDAFTRELVRFFDDVETDRSGSTT